MADQLVRLHYIDAPATRTSGLLAKWRRHRPQVGVGGVVYPRYSTDYAAAETEARKAKRGMFRTLCVKPWVWRASLPPRPTQEPVLVTSGPSVGRFREVSNRGSIADPACRPSALLILFGQRDVLHRRACRRCRPTTGQLATRGSPALKTHLEGAQLVGAHLQGAVLGGTHLEAAWLVASDITQTQFDSAITNEHTEIPHHIKRPGQPATQSDPGTDW